MADAVIGTSYLQVVPKMDMGSLRSESDRIGSDAGGRIGDGIGGGIGAKAVAIGSALGNVISGAASKAASVASDLVTGVFEGASANEQLVGGMQKLFGDDYLTVINNANSAFMTAGKSANDYMEGVTSIAASLVSDCEGDTAEAARLADVAMRAMSDNVNTFGTDADSVQHAITGLAKGNYTMLDNLSLGFAGTQQGMVDLINESGVLDHKLNGTKDLADVGFGTMVEAIQAVQENMSIAGTTSKEAMGTMEGSITAAKSAWENVLTSIGSGDSEQLASAAGGLVDAFFGTVSDKTGEREGGVIENLSNLAIHAFDTLKGYLPGLVEGALSAVPDLVGSALSTLPDGFSQPLMDMFDNMQGLLGDIGPRIKGALGGAFKAVVPVLSSAASTILGVIDGVNGFITDKMLPVWNGIYDTIAPVLSDVWGDVEATFPAIQDAIDTALGAISGLVEDVWPDISATVQTATDLIRDAIEVAWPVIQQVVGDAMDRVSAVMSVVWPVVTKLVKGAVKVIRGAIEGFGPMVSKVKSTFNKIRDAIRDPINTAKKAVSKAIDKIKEIVNGAHLSLPHFKLPHFNISGGKLPWGIGGKGTAPSISVDWYARGGYIDQPTLYGVGERGGELVWPSYEPYLGRYADAIADRIGGGDVNVYLTYNGSGDADEIVRTLTRELRVLKMTGAI